MSIRWVREETNIIQQTLPNVYLWDFLRVFQSHHHRNHDEKCKKKTKVKNYNITYVILYIVWNTNRVLMCWLYIVLILLLFFLFSFLQYTFCSMVLVLVVVRWMVQKKTFVLMMISLIFYLFNMLFHPRTKRTTNIPNNTQQKKKIKILH